MPDWLRPFPGWEHRVLVLLGEIFGFMFFAGVIIGCAMLMERIWPQPPAWFQIATAVVFVGLLVLAGALSFWKNIWRPQ